LGVVLAAGLIAGRPEPISGQADEFDSLVLPILTGTCGTCHNAQLSSGGMSVAELMSADSLVGRRDAWEKILQRLREIRRRPVSSTCRAACRQRLATSNGLNALTRR
jgi:hypothetical protein